MSYDARGEMQRLIAAYKDSKEGVGYLVGPTAMTTALQGAHKAGALEMLELLGHSEADLSSMGLTLPGAGEPGDYIEIDGVRTPAEDSNEEYSVVRVEPIAQPDTPLKVGGLTDLCDRCGAQTPRHAESEAWVCRHCGLRQWFGSVEEEDECECGHTQGDHDMEGECAACICINYEHQEEFSVVREEPHRPSKKDKDGETKQEDKDGT